MRWYWAILLTAVLVFLAVVLAGVIGFDPMIPLMLVTSIWAAIDSGKIELKKYKSGISYSPMVIFIVLMLLWVVGFPWYLHVRYKIKNGLAEIKEVESSA